METYGVDRAVLEDKLNHKLELAGSRRQEWEVVLQREEREEVRFFLKFLLAYMPLHDLADYSPQFFLNHVRQTLMVREQMPWGRKVPAELFLHFVLPYRVNNENIDESREVIYEYLYPRVKDLGMEAAVLETNYWCHEQATYIGTDIRTVSPLTLMRTTLGRCGEQSTLAVAALRSIGIPARQVYTPRWAHCDSNHAWVEAWADGDWHFLGACEPEPVLDEGWFRSPSRQAMLVNTRVSADYSGPEEVCSDHPWYAEINMLDRYAEVREITVTVKDSEGRAAEAEVHFQVYNYAEFSTIVIKKTDHEGCVRLRTGYGDLLVHARGPKGWGLRRIDVRESGCFELALGEHPEAGTVTEFDMVPPAAAAAVERSVPEEVRRDHEKRVKEGTRIRTSMLEGFKASVPAGHLASELGLPEEETASLLEKARGNAGEIAAFLRETASEERELALRLLGSLRDKDLTDTFRPTLVDHLQAVQKFSREEMEEALFDAYVLCPRVHFEMLTPYKRFFQEAFPAEQQEVFRNEPQLLARYVADEVAVNNEIDRYKGMAAPAGAYRLRLTDSLSRDILFVAAARSLGIPARLEPLLLQPQFWKDGSWHDATLDQEKSTNYREDTLRKAGIRFLAPEEAGTEPAEAAYHLNFTVGRLEEGLYRTLGLPFGEKEVYAKPYEVLPGSYRLITGTRQRDGSVKVRCCFFELQPGEQKELQLVFRKEAEERVVIAEIGREAVSALPGARPSGELGGGAAAWVWLEPEREPSKHLLRELRELAADLAELKCPVYVMASDRGGIQAVPAEDLPATVNLIIDSAEAGLKQLQEALPAAVTSERPVTVVADQEGRVTMLSKGYKLGTGREMLQSLKQSMQSGQ